MYLVSKYVDGKEMEILDISEPDKSELEEIQCKYSHFPNIQIDLGSLQYLCFFKCIHTLILTGGIPTSEGFAALYKQQEVTAIILDFEETESDVEGVDLARFSKLSYVLSRSNLNIYHYDSLSLPNVRINVLNYYRDGKRVSVTYDSNYDIFRPKGFLFFSTEAKSPAATLIMNILHPAEENFCVKYHQTTFSNQLDEIAIIPICVPQIMIDQGFGKERKYVSLKKRVADIRLQIPYLEFVNADDIRKIALCKENIYKAAQYIACRDNTFKLTPFLSAINTVLLK